MATLPPTRPANRFPAMRRPCRMTIMARKLTITLDDAGH
jgi:hypothetical protein